ncbi:hypothetical protein Trydic_g21821 [Trypoxylus dichotomus]
MLLWKVAGRGRIPDNSCEHDDDVNAEGDLLNEPFPRTSGEIAKDHNTDQQAGQRAEEVRRVADMAVALAEVPKIDGVADVGDCDRYEDHQLRYRIGHVVPILRIINTSRLLMRKEIIEL